MTAEKKHYNIEKNRKGFIVTAIVVVILIIGVFGMYPTGIEVSTSKEAIRVFDKLDSSDFVVKYSNRFGLPFSVKAFAQDNIVVEPSEVNKDTREIVIKLGEFESKKLTSPIEVKEIRTNFDDKEVYEGDTFNPDEISVELVYTDGYIKDITEEIKESDLFKSNYTYSQYVDISTNTKYGKVVVDPKIRKIESILGEIEGVGEERGVWYEGEVPIINSINIIYSDGSYRNIKIDDADNIKFSDNLVNNEPLKAGENIYSITYGHKQMAFCIKAEPNK